MNVQEAVISLINQELDRREKLSIERESKMFDIGFRIGGEKNFVCHKIKQMRKVLPIPSHIASVYLDSIDYNKEKCPVCLDTLQNKNNIVLTNCGHIFCKSCFDELEQRRITSCPVCSNRVMILDKSEWYEQQQKFADRDMDTETDDDLDQFGFEFSDTDDS